MYVSFVVLNKQQKNTDFSHLSLYYKAKVVSFKSYYISTKLCPILCSSLHRSLFVVVISTHVCQVKIFQSMNSLTFVHAIYTKLESHVVTFRKGFL